MSECAVIIYLEYAWYNCIVMIILLLVELLQVGGVVALAVSSHLVPHLSLLSCLRKTKHTNMHHHRHALFTKPQCP